MTIKTQIMSTHRLPNIEEGEVTLMSCPVPEGTLYVTVARNRAGEISVASSLAPTVVVPTAAEPRPLTSETDQMELIPADVEAAEAAKTAKSTAKPKA